jgi:hypothetical protein
VGSADGTTPSGTVFGASSNPRRAEHFIKNHIANANMEMISSPDAFVFEERVFPKVNLAMIS